MNFDYYVKEFARLENELSETQEYVTFSYANRNTYSSKFASIMDNCGRLINGFCSDLCKSDSPNKKDFKIFDYKEFLKKHKYPLRNYIVCAEFVILPWGRLINRKANDQKSSPKWWKFYNDVKHKGEICEEDASLKNAVSCMAGMFSLLLMYAHKHNCYELTNWRGIFKECGNCKRPISWLC